MSRSSARRSGRARRWPGQALALLPLAACAAAPPPVPVDGAGAADREAAFVEPANVIVIVADDLGRTDISVYDPQSVPTPSLERLASEGIVATQAYASAAVCGPSRAGLITGRYQHRFGFEFNIFEGDDTRGLPRDEITLGEAMAAGGVATAMIGKWHLGTDDESFPIDQGYDLFRGILAGKTSYMDATLPESMFLPTEGTPLPIDRDGPRRFLRAPEMISDDNDDRYLTDVITDEVVAYLDDHADEQFYLHVSYTAPHTPVQTTVAYWDRFPDIEDPYLRARAAMIASLDDGIGRILDKIAALDLVDDTVVIFTSDNGCSTDSQACPCTTQRGLKGSYYEGGISVPFIARLPASAGAGTVYDAPISLLDVFPTALAAAHVALPPVPLDGTDLVPHFLGDDPSAPHAALLWRASPRVASRVGTMKTLWVTSGPVEPEAYDLAVDAAESQDLIAGPYLSAGVDSMYRSWDRHMIPAAWPGREHTDDQCGEILTVAM